jgi:hypothetical protein
MNEAVYGKETQMENESRNEEELEGPRVQDEPRMSVEGYSGLEVHFGTPARSPPPGMR